MKTLVTALVSAALLAAVATQLYHTLLGPNPLALLILFFVSAALTAGAAVQAMRRTQDARAERPARKRPDREQDVRERPVRQRPAAQPEPARQRPQRSRPAQPGGGKREMGTVKWFDSRKGYGFIIRRDGSEIFCHHRDVRRTAGGRIALDDGQRVSFVPRQKDRRWQAEDVIPECTSKT